MAASYYYCMSLPQGREGLRAGALSRLMKASSLCMPRKPTCQCIKYALTSVSRLWNEVDYKAEADNVPLLAVRILIHEEEILLPDRRVPRAKVNGGVLNPARAGRVVIW